MTVVYRWMLTPAELFSCFVPTHSRGAAVTLEVLPFQVAKKPLTGTPYTYQLALSASSNAQDIAPVHAACPDIPVSGDKRAGIIVFHGHKIIASYVIQGQQAQAPRRIVIHKDYRRQGLATRMLEQWFQETPGITNLRRQPINLHAVKVFLKAHKNVVNWAVSTGKPVPQNVRDAVASGAEAAAILAKVAPLEASTPRSRL